MEKEIDLSPFGHAFSPYNRKLKLLSTSNDTGTYCIEEQAWYRIGYDQNCKIEFIDFDGGPFLTIGSKLGNLIVEQFTNDSIILKNAVSN